MTILEAKKMGATHYSLSKSGKFIQLFYRQKKEKLNDGTWRTVWQFISHAGIWQNGTNDWRHPRWYEQNLQKFE